MEKPKITFGIELEGGWPLRHVDDGGGSRHGFVHDGSVAGLRAPDDRPLYVGEYNSTAYDGIKELLEDVKEEWPQFYNSTCGMHIHAGLSAEIYSRFMERSFNEEFKKKTLLWAEMIVGPEKDRYLQRLSGQNSYCTAGWAPEKQSIARGKDSCRYRALNFCWSLHKTMECRLFPMMKIEQATPILLDYEKFLREMAEKKSRMISIPIDIEDTAKTPKQVWKI
jgi:hypothetical protein